MLYLYRHAVELALKEAILEAVYLRALQSEEDPSRAIDTMREHLKEKLGHKIGSLRDELNRQLSVLDLQPIEPEVGKVLEWINLLDWNGAELRYTNQRTYWQGDVDLPSLVTTLDKVVPYLSAVHDAIEHEADSYEEWQEAMRDYGAY